MFSGIRFTLTEAAVERLESREQRELGASPGGLVGRLEKRSEPEHAGSMYSEILMKGFDKP